MPGHFETTGEIIALSGGDAGPDGACVICHGLNGEGDGNLVPALDGMDPGYLARQMEFFAAGLRRDPQMRRIADRLDWSARQKVAFYYASRDAPPASRGVLLVVDGLLVDGYPDAPARWLADLHPQLEGRSLVVFASVEEVDAALRRHFSRFPVDISYVDEGDTLRVVAGDGSESTSVLRFERASIAEEAARTGAAPGDLARVEIDRAMTLLDLAPR